MTEDFIAIPQQAPCIYFGRCGGCSIQNISNHREYKFHQFKMAINNLAITNVHELVQIQNRTRRRTNFKVDNKKLCFNQSQSKQLIPINDCLLLEDAINALITPLNNLLKKINIAIDNISITNSDTGVEIVFFSQKKSDLTTDLLITDFAKRENISRAAWQINKQSPYLIVQFKPVQLQFDNISVDLPINSFLQVSKESNNIMNDIILRHLETNKPVLELYCGAGSFTIPISKINKITAIEGNIAAIKAIEESAKRHKLPITAISQDIYQTPFTTRDMLHFSQVVINPPRNGATPQIKQISLSKNIKKIILISCSLENFIRDAKILLKENFILSDIYPIDQFLYSDHLEIIGIFNS